MKICRVSNSYPSNVSPGGGLVPYFLSLHIDEPTLYITRKSGEAKRAAPEHVVLIEIDEKDTPTPTSLKDEIHTDEKKSVLQKIVAHLKVLITMRGVTFFLKSIPSLLAYRPDIVACHQNLSIIHGFFAKYFLGSRFIIHLHNNTEIKAIRNLWLLRWLVQRADLIFCLSKSMGNELDEIAPLVTRRIRYTSTGVDSDIFKNYHNTRKKQLIAIGNFKWEKGYEYLLYAMSLVFTKYPTYSLIILGDGREKDVIVNQIKKLGLSDNVTLMGILSREAVAELLNESKLFVMSSLFEGLPKALLEAMACGTPAVITTGCNADDIIQERGLLVEKRDSQALSDAVIKLIEDNAFWQKCSANAESIIESHSWEGVAQKVYRDYQEIMQ